MISVVGMRKRTFKFKDGNSVSGMDLHLVVDDSEVTGQAVERVFISDQKLGSYVPSIGDCIDIRYNRFGKVQSVELVTA